MAKEDDVVAAAMAKPIRDGYPKLTEDHPFFGKLRAFTNEKTHWLGTATDLLTEMNDSTTPPNTVTKLLNKYWYRLKSRDGIVIHFRRTNRRRIILSKQEYCGDTVNFRSQRKSFKNKKKVELPPEEWLIFENTHPAIIDRETFELVRELRSN